ncbi:MAG: hypothetical protein A2V74_00690 [Acidobacteria bacterium RBG_16_70_10]|nr:MAG: hypothetical protein A2V74_00690 [Acidobacteria bacterium RBG_16_70_10]
MSMPVSQTIGRNSAYVSASPADQRSSDTPVAPATTQPPSRASSIALKVSGWIRVSASTKASIAPLALRAPPLRTAPMTRFSTVTTRHPLPRAIAAVESVETLSATMTSTASRPAR